MFLQEGQESPCSVSPQQPRTVSMICSSVGLSGGHLGRLAIIPPKHCSCSLCGCKHLGHVQPSLDTCSIHTAHAFVCSSELVVTSLEPVGARRHGSSPSVRLRRSVLAHPFEDGSRTSRNVLRSATGKSPETFDNLLVPPPASALVAPSVGC